MSDGEKILKERIKTAARKLFSLHGFNAVSVNDITSEADVNKSLLFYYYKNKKNLFIEFAREKIQDTLSFLKSRIDPQLPPDQKMCVLLDCLLESFYSDDSYCFFKFPMQLSLANCHDMAEALHPDTLQMLHFVSEIIQDGIDSSIFVQIDPILTAKFIFRAYAFLHLEKNIIGTLPPREEIYLFFKTLFLEGLLL